MSQLASGSIAEALAETLFKHIDQCPSCQNSLDDIESSERRQLMAGPNAAPSQPNPVKLENLIQQAQQLGRKPVRSESAHREVSPDHFVSGLRRCGLFRSEEVDALISDVRTEDSSSIARALVGRQKLTAFQARALLKGRWKGLVLGNYEILEKIGQGGMGSVFRARHRRLGRIVCVKVMNQAGRKSESMLERFRNEARTIAALTHPSFIVAHDADEAEGVPFLAMEFVEGVDLARHVHDNGPLTLHEALNVIRQVADAMQYAHEKRVTHRDLKPHNIMLVEDAAASNCHVKVLDLGLARFDSVLNDDPDGSLKAAMTNTGVIMGTVDYMAPEQAIRSRDADNRSDIYSLGCTLHYLVTGAPVYEGDTVMARLIAHREQVIPSLEQSSFAAMPHLDKFFFKLVAKDPQERYQSMQEVAADVSLLLEGGVPSCVGDAPAGSTSVLDRVRSRRARVRYSRWVVGGVLFCAACLGVWAQRERTQRPQHVAQVAEPELPDVEERSSVQSMFGAIDSSGFNFRNAGTITAGGNGTALIVLPFERANLEQLVAWEEALKDLGVDVMYASSEWGQTVSRGGYEMPHARSIEGIRIDQLDMILFTGGETEGFDRNVAVNEALRSLLRSAMPQGVVLGCFSGTRYEALDSVLELCGQSSQDGILSCRSPVGQEGVYLETATQRGNVVKQLQAATSLIRAAVEIRREQVENRNQIDRLAFYETLDPGRLRRNWGAGRALVVLPFDGYSGKELNLVRRVLETEAGMELLVTSSEWGTPVSDRGHSSFNVSIMLDQFSADHFDYVVFVGGDTTPFSSDHDLTEKLRRVVKTSLESGLIVTSVSRQASEFLKLTGPEIYDCVNRTEKGPVYSGTYKQGRVAVIDRAEYLRKLRDELVGQRDRILRPGIQTD